jgi:molybdopterin biosynthesis enzyme
VHTVLADIRSVPDRAVLEDVVKAAGANLVVADIAADDGSARHDPVKLAAAYDAVIAAGGSPRG